MEMTRDELAAAIDAAHSRGVLIRGHLVNKRGIMMALELGIDIVDHCDEMDDEVIAALVETGASVVPSLHFPKSFLEYMGSGLGFAADAIRADLEHMYEVIPEGACGGRALRARRRLRRRSASRTGPTAASCGSTSSTPACRRSTSIRWATRNGAGARPARARSRHRRAGQAGRPVRRRR